MVLVAVAVAGDLRYVPRLPGMRSIGVPPGGPFDEEAAILAAVLAGSQPEALVELAFGQATFLVEAPGALVTVEGSAGTRRWLHAGETITLMPKRSARLTLATPGGFQTPPLGPDPDRSLVIAAGSSLYGSGGTRVTDAKIQDSEPPPPVLFVEDGPGREGFDFPLPDLTVSPQLDRRGVRLLGAPLHSLEVASEPCVPGAIQWTPAGEFIILGPDGPTVGGYPKPFVVIPASMPTVARLRPGDRPRLVHLGENEAAVRNQTWREELRRRADLLRLAAFN